MSTVNLTCKHCDASFLKNQKEYNRQLKNGRTQTDFFCSRKCSCSWRNNHMTNNEKIDRDARLLKHQIIASTKGANISRKGRFTYYLKKARERSLLRKHWDDTNLSEQYLGQIWEQQNGLCIWTGLPMKLTNYNNRNQGLYGASLDRIDSTKGYVIGNVQFVLTPLNKAKGNSTELEFKNFIKWIIDSCCQRQIS